jgi:hypothetical protein
MALMTSSTTPLHLVLARDPAELELSAAGVLAARSVESSDSAVGVVFARNVTARNVRVLFGGRAAVAFGATAGSVLMTARSMAPQMTRRANPSTMWATLNQPAEGGPSWPNQSGIGS